MKNVILFIIVNCMSVFVALTFGLAREAKINEKSMILSKEISFKSSKDKLLLYGTLSRPKIKPKGAVLLIVGSGKVDCDETTPGDITFSGKTEKL